MLISPAYKEQNKSLHSAGTYGISGHKWAETVKNLIERTNAESILDYGCGRCTLQTAVAACAGITLPRQWTNYDPCIDGLDDPPEPADVVVCTDVLEHIEPECLNAVLDDLKRVTRKFGLFVIANRPARKVLPDGRNAHLIQAGPRWWLPKLCERFEIVQVTSIKGEFMVLCRA